MPTNDQDPLRSVTNGDLRVARYRRLCALGGQLSVRVRVYLPDLRPLPARPALIAEATFAAHKWLRGRALEMI